MWVGLDGAFRGMDAEDERHMDVLERPHTGEPTYLSTDYYSPN